jgi:hypothetical protein
MNPKVRLEVEVYRDAQGQPCPGEVRESRQMKSSSRSSSRTRAAGGIAGQCAAAAGRDQQQVRGTSQEQQQVLLQQVAADQGFPVTLVAAAIWESSSCNQCTAGNCRVSATAT